VSEGIPSTDTVVAHPKALTNLTAAARSDGAAAANRQTHKIRNGRERAGTGACALKGMGMGTCGRLGAWLMRLFNRNASNAEASDTVDKCASVVCVMLRCSCSLEQGCTGWCRWRVGWASAALQGLALSPGGCD
jgi:hypothetical protein